MKERPHRPQRMIRSLPVVVALAGVLWAGDEPVVLVRGTFTAQEQPSEARGVGRYHQTVLECVKRLGLAHRSITDGDVEKGALAGARVAILPYNSRLSDREVEQIEAFVESGGKLIVFYSLNERIGTLLGLGRVRHQRAEYPGQFCRIEFDGRLRGGPKSILQESWNIYVVEPTRVTTRVVGRWVDKAGKDTGHVGLALSPAGAYVSHVLTEGDVVHKTQLVASLLVHLAPDLGPDLCEKALGQVGAVGRFTGLEEMARALRETQAGTHLKRAQEHAARARAAAGGKQFGTALEEIAMATQEANTAFYASQPSKEGEFRAVWIHTAFGLGEGGWERSMKILAENNFSAVVPNMLWGGVAYYPSQVLPVDPSVAERGDQIAQCVEAGKKFGVQVHVWKVNHNLSRAPKEFVERMRAEGRTQKTFDGEDVDWLCPSHPDNFKLEFDSIMEVIKNYRIDGFHFDYIRYPHDRACYCEGCRERFQKDTGVTVEKWPDDVRGGDLTDQFQDWRREQVTRLVRAVSEEAHKIKPDIAISAAVFNDWVNHRRTVGQDTVLWLKESYLDFVCPMDYTTDIEDLRKKVTQQGGFIEEVAVESRRVPLYIGIGAFRLPDPADLIEQIQLARELGADGFVLFQYNEELAEQKLPALLLGVTEAPPLRGWKN